MWVQNSSTTLGLFRYIEPESNRTAAIPIVSRRWGARLQLGELDVALDLFVARGFDEYGHVPVEDDVHGELMQLADTLNLRATLKLWDNYKDPVIARYDLADMAAELELIQQQPGASKRVLNLAGQLAHLVRVAIQQDLPIEGCSD